MTLRPQRVRIEATRAPEPTLLRAAIAARLAGRPYPSRAEDHVAEQVARVVRERLAREGRTWR